MRQPTQTTKIIALTVILLIAVGVYTGHSFLKSSLPPTEGELHFPLLDEPVTITRDAFGIPHIEAQNKLDAMRALGFSIASERLFQLDMLRRLTHGRLSEVFGLQTLESDKLYRSLLLKKTAERLIEHEKANGKFDEQHWAEMQAYFDGVNYYAENFPLSYEFTFLGIKPEKFSPIDAYVMTGHMAFSFASALTSDPLMTTLAAILPEDKFHELRNEVPEGKFTKPTQQAGLDFETLFKELPLINGFSYFEGSNGWLIDQRRSGTGSHIFANDPHIAYSLPAVWYEAHLKTPDFEIYGHYLPLLPFAVLGHNHDKAWGFTMTLTDDMDLYRETLDRQNQTALFKGKPESYSQHEEQIAIKDKDPLNMQIIETAHGPLLDNVLGLDLSLKWSFHRIENNTMKALQKMNDSQSIREFEEALKLATAPGLNVLYADKEHIAWWMVGDIALKKNPHSDLVLDGASGKDEYIRYLTWDEKPHAINPDTGLIVSANSRPQGLRKDIRGDWQSDDRYETILRKLQGRGVWTAEDTKKLQVADENHMTEKILTVLLEALTPEQRNTSAFKELADWNFKNSADSKAPAYYHLWLNEIILFLLEDLPPAYRAAYLKTSYAWVFLEKTITNPESKWWGHREPSSLLSQSYDRMLKHAHAHRPWGKVHTLEFVHPLGRIRPLNHIFNEGPFPVSGAYNDINNQKMRNLGSSFRVIAGPSTRRVIDMATPEFSWGISPLGNSGHRLSPHFKDQVSLFIQSKHRPQHLDLERVNKESTGVLKLQP